jgi:hypothetical protein
MLQEKRKKLNFLIEFLVFNFFNNFFPNPVGLQHSPQYQGLCCVLAKIEMLQRKKEKLKKQKWNFIFIFLN